MSGKFDILFRFLSDKTFISLIKLLSGYEIISDVPITENLLIRAEERFVDRVFKALDSEGKVYILHIEIQTQNHPGMHERMFEYGGILYRSLKLPVMQMCLYIGEETLTMQDYALLPLFTYRYLLIDLKKVSAEAFLTSDNLEMCILALLTDFKTFITPEALFEDLSRRVIAYNTFGDSADLKNFLDLISTFSTLREELTSLSTLFMETLKLKLTREQIRKTYLFAEGIAEGKAEATAEFIIKLFVEKHETPQNIATFLRLPLDDVIRVLKTEGFIQ